MLTENLTIILAIIGLIFSILFSSSEIALISANKLQIDVWRKQRYTFSKITKNILNNKTDYLTVSLIGTNLANILATTFFTVFFIDLINNGKLIFLSEELIFFPIALIILFFGEILPKAIIIEHATIMILVLSPILKFFYFIFYPIVFLFRGLVQEDKKHFIKSKEYLNEKRQEFQTIFEENNDLDTIEKEQKEMISNIFDYREQTIGKVMTPIESISTVHISSTLDEVARVFIDSGHSKLPVYDKNLDDIKGVVYLYDLYSKPENLDDIKRDVLFVPYSKLIPDLMKKFKDTKHSIAIVLDQDGKTSGIITIEDIFEELFGDFEDEFDYEKINSVKLDDGSFIINAKMTIEDFNKEFNNLIPDGPYETIGGYIIKKTGKIPHKNEHLFLDIGQVIIRKGSSRRIEQIQLYKI